MRVRFSRIWLWLNSGGPRRAIVAAALLLLAALVGVVHYSAKAASSDKSDRENAGSNAGSPVRGSKTDTLELSDAQLGEISTGTVSERSFPIQTEAVGSIDFNEDMAAQVFPPYQGRIVKLFAMLGDNVKRGQPLLTIESPDLIQAESTLIAAAGVLDLTSHVLERAKQLSAVEGIAVKDLQQAISDQQTAEGALKAARDAVAVFGKSPSPTWSCQAPSQDA
jgi:cobalt-zinc-cadmium efflux system membrane fusion protein